MKKIYIDYENIQGSGLRGIEKLEKEDKVFIFYSSSADNMKIEIVRSLLSASAEVSFIDVEHRTPNALDFELVASMFMNISADIGYYIISRDTGFDAAISIGKKNGYSISRISCIEDIFIKDIIKGIIVEMPKIAPVEISKTAPVDIISDICGKEIANKHGELIINGVKNNSNKSDLYRFFIKALGDKNGRDLYLAIRKQFNQMKMLI